ncbi:transcription factor bHLH92 [Malania oleifera]|uniref:transcription factor bHLH92 n=1 Tax=Malania oleifera TaxID=397392 RepID=UPI0025AE6B5C|nr:transcription factor bHLH92 [Malania oleifera]
MVDQFFEEDLQRRMVGLEAALPVNRTAFERFPSHEFPRKTSQVSGSNLRNMNKRAIELLRRNWVAAMESKEPDRGRSYRHMISERNRREKQKQSYLALHSLLPHGTKNDKNSIIQTAAMEIQEMQRKREELRRRNKELEAESEEEKEGVFKIRLRVGNAASGVDSMVEVLKCVKNLGVQTTAIRSEFSTQELSATLKIETMQMEAADLENAVQRALHEAGRKLQPNFREEGEGGIRRN